MTDPNSPHLKPLLALLRAGRKSIAKPCANKNASGMKGIAVRLFGSRSASMASHLGTQRSSVIRESLAHDAARINPMSNALKARKTSARPFEYPASLVSCTREFDLKKWKERVTVATLGIPHDRDWSIGRIS